MPAVSMLRRKKMRYVKMPRYRQMSQAERKGMLREEMSLEKLSWNCGRIKEMRRQR